MGTKIYLGMAWMSDTSGKRNNKDSMNFIIGSAKIWFGSKLKYVLYVPKNLSNWIEMVG